MISRIRMDAFGETAQEVANILENHAHEITRLLGNSVPYGEQVISRNLAEPEGSVFAWEGRMNLHPEIGRTVGAATTNAATGTSNFRYVETSGTTFG
jgi:hypothetical protein